ncbi:uncharacterized protein LOC62_04G005372 [Vanrija pseudolonga]|uniref:Uncharacterized protein n=1 Tax=Vanrija pseudolonga TaxID=143232 RepID=A0AAF1BMB0_9TREE|nr:hypothetical protein LOC62_04G005372 [Vanrija pseudolonga]
MMDVLNAALTVTYPVHRAYPFGRWFHRVSALLLAAVGVFIVLWAVATSAYEPVPVSSETFSLPHSGWYLALVGKPRPCQSVVFGPGDSLHTTNAVFDWSITQPTVYSGTRLNCSIAGTTIAVAGPSVVSELVATCAPPFGGTLSASHASNGVNSSTAAILAALGLPLPPRTAVVGALDAVAYDLGTRLKAVERGLTLSVSVTTTTSARAGGNGAFSLLTTQYGDNGSLPDALRTPLANYVAVLSTAAAYDLGIESNTSVATSDSYTALSPLTGALSLAAAPKPLPQPPGATLATRYACTAYVRKPLGAAIAATLATAGALWLPLLALFHTLTKLASKATSQRNNFDLSFGPDGSGGSIRAPLARNAEFPSLSSSDKYGVSDMATNGTNPSARRTSIETITYGYEPVKARDVDELARYMRMGEYGRSSGRK